MLLWFSVAAANDTWGDAAFRLPAAVSDLGFVTDGLAALTTSDRIVSIDLPDGRVGAARPTCEYPAHFAPHGDRVAMTCNYEKLVMLSWPALSPIGSAPYEDGEVVWAADGSGLALVRGEGITLYDRALNRVGSATGWASQLVGRAGRWYATGPLADDGVVALGPDGAERWKVPGGTEDLALSVDGKRLLLARERALVLLDTKTGAVIRSIPRPDTAYDVVATRAGWWVSVTGGFERVDDAGKVLGRVDGRGTPLASGDGAWVLAESSAPVPSVWRADGTPLHDEPLRGSVVAVAGRRGTLAALTSSGAVLDVGASGVSSGGPTPGVRVRGVVDGARDLAVGPGGAVAVAAGPRLVGLDGAGRARDLAALLEDEYALAVRADGTGWLAITDRGLRSVADGALGPLRPLPLASLERMAVGAGRVATAGESGFDVWDLGTGRPLLDGHVGEVWGLGIRPDGAVVAGATKGYDDVTTRVVVVPGPPAEAWELCCQLAVAPDGRFVAEGREAQIRAWDPARRALLASWTLSAPVASLWVPAPDTVVAQLEDGRLEVIDASAIPAPNGGAGSAPNLPTAVPRPAEGDRVDGFSVDLRWTAAGRLLRVGSSTIDEVDPRTGVVKTRLDVYGWVHAATLGDDLVALSREGDVRRLVRARPDREIVWEVTPEADHDVFAGGSRVVVAGHGGFEVRDAATGSLLRSAGRDQEAEALSADGSTLAVEIEGTLVLLSAADGAVLRTLPVSDPCSVAFSPDGSRLAAADESGRTFVLPVSGGVPVALDGIGRCPALAWSPDGASLATRMRDELLVWDARKGKNTAVFSLGEGQSVAWGAAGLATDDGEATVILRP